ncbi:MAG: Hsp20/alpha crystallin family protein [Hyphomicrobiales bacterium]
MVERSHAAGWWPSVYEPLRKMSEKVADWFAPRADAVASGDFYEINMELPGVSVGDIDVSIHEDTLTIKGQKRFEREEKGRTYFFSEREFGAFQRSFRLPAEIDSGAVNADFVDGVLTVRVPKAAPPEEKVQRIEIGRR